MSMEYNNPDLKYSQKPSAAVDNVTAPPAAMNSTASKSQRPEMISRDQRQKQPPRRSRTNKKCTADLSDGDFEVDEDDDLSAPPPPKKKKKKKSTTTAAKRATVAPVAMISSTNVKSGTGCKQPASNVAKKKPATSAAKKKAATCNPSKQPATKPIPREVAARCHDRAKEFVHETHYYFMNEKGKVVGEVDAKYIVEVKGKISLDRVSFEKDGKVIPSGTSLKVERPYYYIRKKKIKPKDNAKLVAELRQIIGPDTEYDKSDKQIRDFLKNKIMKNLREVHILGSNAGEKKPVAATKNPIMFEAKKSADSNEQPMKMETSHPNAEDEEYNAEDEESKIGNVSNEDSIKCQNIIKEFIQGEYYCFMDKDGGVIARLDPKLVIDDDEGLRLNRDLFDEIGYSIPPGATLTKSKIYSYITKKKLKHGDTAVLMNVLRPIIGQGTKYNRSDEQINGYLLQCILPIVRPNYLQQKNAGEKRDRPLENLLVQNETNPERGVNRILKMDDKVKKDMIALIQNGVLPEESRPSLVEAMDIVVELLCHDLGMEEDEARRLMTSPPAQIILENMRLVELASLDPKNVSAVQDAQNVRGTTTLNLLIVAHGIVKALVDGTCMAVEYIGSDEYKGGRRGVLVPIGKGKKFRGSCVGALIQKEAKGLYSADHFARNGANVEIDVTEMVLVDIFTCRVFTIMDDLFGHSYSRYFRESIIALGDGLYIGLRKIPEMDVRPGGQIIYSVDLSKCGIGHIQIHQLVEMAKREIDISSRGGVSKVFATMIGQRGKTPDEIFPIIGRGCSSDYESRVDFITYENQHEVSDVEHCLTREKYEHNGAFFTRALNHSLNCRITTTQSHDTNGTGDFNFCHLQLKYKKNAKDVEMSDEYKQRKNESSRKHSALRKSRK